MIVNKTFIKNGKQKISRLINSTSSPEDIIQYQLKNGLFHLRGYNPLYLKKAGVHELPQDYEKYRGKLLGLNFLNHVGLINYSEPIKSGMHLNKLIGDAALTGIHEITHAILKAGNLFSPKHRKIIIRQLRKGNLSEIERLCKFKLKDIGISPHDVREKLDKRYPGLKKRAIKKLKKRLQNQEGESIFKRTKFRVLHEIYAYDSEVKLGKKLKLNTKNSKKALKDFQGVYRELTDIENNL